MRGTVASVTITPASERDIDLLVAMMREFYAEASYPLDPVRARRAFMELLSTPMLGRSLIVMLGTAPVGYLVLTITFSMEYGGRAAFLDDLYIRPAFRGKGVGTAALDALRALALDLGLRAIRLEVGGDDAAAQKVYRKAGFVDAETQLLTLRLAPRTHETGT